ncbi:MAG: TonB family protein [Aridibacter famidurans]|nr:TonB family protein [Aridibacter famidurans]
MQRSRILIVGQLFFVFALCASVVFAQLNKEADRCKVVMAVEFRNTGEIGDIRRVNSNCEGSEHVDSESFWFAATEAARRIEFVPPIIERQPRTVVKEVTYLFDPNAERLLEEEPDREIIILHQPRAAYPRSDTGTVCIRGTVILRATFNADGAVESVNVVKGMPFGATENAIEAAKQIAFLPATRNGVPMTINRVVHFNFSIY